jgi:hypothetical protein
MGVGTETSGTKVVVLLEQQGTSWQAMNLVDLRVLKGLGFSAVTTSEYLVPPDVLAKMATALGLPVH